MTAIRTDLPDTLARIVAATRTTLALRREREPLLALERRAAAASPRGRAFERALSAPARLNLIAECKRRSPSRGVLAEHYDPAGVAAAYERGGAAAISVLTEPNFFDGALEHLTAVRAAVAVPVLRKDFVIDEYQLHEARAAGADAVLLIVAALAQPMLARLHARAQELGIAALVEVHDADELRRAADAGARVIGVNNRDLRTLAVDLRTSHTLAPLLPRDVIAVAESGLRTPDDLRALATAGYQAFLVGERLMTDADPQATLRELSGQGTFVKICGITRLEDARLAARAGASAVGFVFWPRSPRCVSPEQAHAIIAELPRAVTPVGVFVNASAAEIRDVRARSGVRAVQLHGDETPELADALDVPVLRSMTLEDAGRDLARWPRAVTVLLDATDPERRGGTGTPVDLEAAARSARARDLVLAGGLTPDSVAAAIRTVRPLGVDVSSGVEDAPGVKNERKIITFIDSARAALAVT